MLRTCSQFYVFLRFQFRSMFLSGYAFPSSLRSELFSSQCFHLLSVFSFSGLYVPIFLSFDYIPVFRWSYFILFLCLSLLCIYFFLVYCLFMFIVLRVIMFIVPYVSRFLIPRVSMCLVQLFLFFVYCLSRLLPFYVHSSLSYYVLSSSCF